MATSKKKAAPAAKPALTALTAAQIKSMAIVNPDILGGIYLLPKRKGYSLHIGLNSVNPAKYAGWAGPLAACESDANDMESIAKTGAFAKITKLLTAKATRAAVINTLNSYAKTMVAGDFLFVSYSGHGGQVPDYSGEEDDNNDETWCLYDGQLIDDELKIQWTKFAKGVRIFILSDSCHSGSVSRDALVRDAKASGHGTPRAMPTAIALKTYRDNKGFYDAIINNITISGIENIAMSDINPSVRLISGCQDNQVSYDGTFNGLFTGNMLKAWNNGNFKGNYSDFYKKIMTYMPNYQSPRHSVIGTSITGYGLEKPFTI